MEVELVIQKWANLAACDRIPVTASGKGVTGVVSTIPPHPRGRLESIKIVVIATEY